MISVSTKSPYAVLALAELAQRAGPEPVPIGELARRRDVPVQFLEQLFATLRRAGIISSQFYTTLVVAAVLTSQIAGAWLDYVLRKGWPLLNPLTPGQCPKPSTEAPSAA